MDDITPKLVDCFRTVFPDIPATDIPAARQDSVSSWDSVATINLVTVIEDEFRVHLDYERLEEMTSFQALASYLREILAASQP